MGQLENLIKLQAIDTEIMQLKKRLTEILQQQKEPAKLQAARQRAEKAAVALQEWHAKNTNRELELKGVTQKRQNAENRLYSGKVSNPKELDDLQKSVAALGRQRDTLEDGLIETMVMLEEATEEDTAAAQALAELDGRWKTTATKLQTEQYTTATRLNALLGERQSAAAKIDAKLLREYTNLLKKKGGVAVALIKNNICQGCRIGLTSDVLRRADRHEIFNCPSCGRLLAKL